jgi:hypothetical protein
LDRHSAFCCNLVAAVATHFSSLFLRFRQFKQAAALIMRLGVLGLAQQVDEQAIRTRNARRQLAEK